MNDKAEELVHRYWPDDPCFYGEYDGYAAPEYRWMVRRYESPVGIGATLEAAIEELAEIERAEGGEGKEADDSKVSE